jgi:hypothetical protein
MTSPADARSVDARSVDVRSVAPRRRLLVVLLVAAALLSAGTATVAVLRRSPNRPGVGAHDRPPLLPAAGHAAPLVVHGADGSAITCPTGSVPTVMLTAGRFSPPLILGSTMAKGHYHIVMRGTVANETSAAVAVHRLTATVRGRPWRPRITVAATIPPQSSADLVIDGTFVSTEVGPVDVRTQFDWRWRSADLTECGGVGLVEDD